MNKKYLKDFAFLAGVIICCAIAARVLARGETLEEYAQKNDIIPESSEVASTGAETSSTDESSSFISSKELITTYGTYTANQSSNEESVISSKNSNKEASLISSLENTQTLSDALSSTFIYKDGFCYEPISNEIFKRISGISYPVDCSVPLDDLRYLSLLYNDFNGDTQTGEMICNKAVAKDLLEIFYELYQNGYQIESIKLIDEFDGDDTSSMLANNTSCFNYRVVEGTTRLSNHAKGLAVDLNPFYNPYITYNKDGSINISPEGSEAYADRSSNFPYKIDENDLAYKLFKEHGFTWGGNWNSVKDYQHFERSK
ncbi:D-alanyl-D-alanine carboxypeptidase [Butyrivibrio proteoclasticus]|uniref:D-alanyl-D-alanine carboxypeptidase n=1 Tax=Butyrivibrio proteoclasticus TaxID=43305 RepID=A0A1I5W7S7_9FIRM|nr:M15 family metallopeptidase [Butyrivibrio proteoclasticus]SFQ15795.1 D-alanyl-D-alanine carboxypeptidase [Butyrivibrio proteoclasticus]